ncbi:MAG TPA: nicotinamide riboside transporter PnuC, partial [Flavobacteriaceae bacterium]|nr:nicotinamide riboside transporter PnuC [Flavobacteriaceae bacterium]
MFETLFAPYQEYSAINIFLEITAVVFAVISVLYSKKNSINVYPTGIVSILIFMYLLYQWELFGDLIINIYYFIMSVYGWVLWSRKKEGVSSLKVEKISLKEYKISGVIFFLSTLLVSAVYILFEKFGYWWSYVDILTTGLFFIGMYLLARRKVEHWLFL